MSDVLDVFARPERWPWAVALLVVGLGVVFALARIARRRRAAVFGADDTPAGLDTRDALLVAVGLVACGVALLDPRWGATDVGAGQAADVVVCVDVSRSMLARDVAPSRLDWTRAALRDLAGATRGERLALVAFAGDARLVVPLTEDAASLAVLADDVGPWSVARGGTDLGAALDAAAGALAAVPDERAAAIVLITDGEGHDVAAPEALAPFVDVGVPVHTVAVGSTRGAKIPIGGEGGERYVVDASGRDVVTRPDVARLTELAARSGGEALHVASTDADVSLAPLLRRVARRRGVELPDDDDPTRRRPRHAWFVGLAVVVWLATNDGRWR